MISLPVQTELWKSYKFLYILLGIIQKLYDFPRSQKKRIAWYKPPFMWTKHYTEKSEENHTTFVWLSSLWLLPHSVSWIPLLWAFVYCPHCSLIAYPPSSSNFFTFQLKSPLAMPPPNLCDLSPLTESGNVTTSDQLPTIKANWRCKPQVRRNKYPIFADVQI